MIVLQKPKAFVQPIMYGGKLSENDLLTRVRLCENPKQKTSMALPPDSDLLVEELKHVHLHLSCSFTYLNMFIYTFTAFVESC